MHAWLTQLLCYPLTHACLFATQALSAEEVHHQPEALSACDHWRLCHHVNINMQHQGRVLPTGLLCKRADALLHLTAKLNAARAFQEGALSAAADAHDDGAAVAAAVTATLAALAIFMKKLLSWPLLLAMLVRVLISSRAFRGARALEDCQLIKWVGCFARSFLHTAAKSSH